MINVTKPFLPPKEEYLEILDGIWERVWLTNNGPIVNELELRLKEYLDIDHLLFLGNGTIAIQIAIQTLELSGEVITTPFSYVATTSSIVWEKCKPVFVDISEKDLNINPNLIETAITKDTSAILATHVYGNPCEIDKIQIIANKHNLKVIYDAAHCFGTKYKGESILKFGDISTISFHATKLFNTIEGGAVATTNPIILKQMALKRNFGHDGSEKFSTVGINGKNSEFHAAMGLVNLRYADEILETRKKQWLYYVEKLKKLDIQLIEINSDTDFNYAYFPIIFPTENSLHQSVKALNDQNVYPRRYFYPSLNKIDYTLFLKQSCPVAEDISRRVLILPLFHTLRKAEMDMICRILLRIQNYG